MATVKWAQQKKRPAQGVAVAEVHYKPDRGGAHAINAVLIDGKRLRFIEPQKADWVSLSEKEIKSIYFMRF